MDEHDLLEQQKRVRGWKTLNWNIFLMSCVVEKGEKTHFGVGTSCCPKWRILKYLVHKWGRVEWEWQMNQRSGSCMVCCENLNMKARPWHQTFFLFLFGCVQNFSFVLLKIINILISVPLVRPRTSGCSAVGTGASARDGQDAAQVHAHCHSNQRWV